MRKTDNKIKIEKIHDFLAEAGFGPFCKRCLHGGSYDYNLIERESIIKPPCKYIKNSLCFTNT